MSSLSLATNILKTLETSSSIGMFARDTGGCLLSKLALSRSKEETKEVSFAELSESSIFYFSAPAAAKAAAKGFSKIYNIDKDTLTSPVQNLKNLPAETLKKVKLGKFGQIASVFSLVLPLVFAIAPFRNLITLSNSGKEKFTTVVGLDKQEFSGKKSEKEDAKNKAKKLGKTLATTAITGLAATAGILTLSKNKTFYKKVEPLLDKAIQAFDFTKNGDLELAHYGALIYPVSIASYFYASRDKYEKAENARRFSITVPLMFFGEKLIEKPIHRGFDKLFKTNVMDKSGQIKSYKEILALPAAKQKQFLKTKNWAYGLTFFINTLAIAAAVAGLNRFETKRKYDKENSLKTAHREQLKESIEQWKRKNIRI